MSDKAAVFGKLWCSMVGDCKNISRIFLIFLAEEHTFQSLIVIGSNIESAAPGFQEVVINDIFLLVKELSNSGLLSLLE